MQLPVPIFVVVASAGLAAAMTLDFELYRVAGAKLAAKVSCPSFAKAGQQLRIVRVVKGTDVFEERCVSLSGC